MVSMTHVYALEYCRMMQDKALQAGNGAMFVFWTKWERHVTSQCERPYTRPKMGQSKSA